MGPSRIDLSTKLPRVDNLLQDRTIAGRADDAGGDGLEAALRSWWLALAVAAAVTWGLGSPRARHSPCLARASIAGAPNRACHRRSAATRLRGRPIGRSPPPTGPPYFSVD